MLLDLLALVAALFSPSPTRATDSPLAPIVARFPEVRAVVVTTPSGDLCVVDPDDASLVQEVPAGAVDLVATDPSVGAVVALAPGDDGQGELLTYSFAQGKLGKSAGRPFSAEGGRLLSARPNPIGYAFDEGSTLFAIDGGTSTGAVEGYPRSVVALPGVGATTVFALEDAGVTWAIRKSIVTGGAVVDLGVEEEIPRGAGGTAGLLVEDGEPRVVTLVGHLLTKSRLDGAVLAQGWVSTEKAEIADAIAVPGAVMVLTRPAAKLFLLRDADAIAVPMKGAGTIPDAPWFSHRLALDRGRRRLWVATDDALLRVELRSLLASRVTACAATAVAVVESR